MLLARVAEKKADLENLKEFFHLLGAAVAG